MVLLLKHLFFATYITNKLSVTLRKNIDIQVSILMATVVIGALMLSGPYLDLVNLIQSIMISMISIDHLFLANKMLSVVSYYELVFDPMDPVYFY